MDGLAVSEPGIDSIEEDHDQCWMLVEAYAIVRAGLEKHCPLLSGLGMRE